MSSKLVPASTWMVTMGVCVCQTVMTARERGAITSSSVRLCKGPSGVVVLLLWATIISSLTVMFVTRGSRMFMDSPTDVSCPFTKQLPCPVDSSRELLVQNEMPTPGDCIESNNSLLPSPELLLKALRTERVFFNRLPKCGTELVMSLMLNLTAKHNFTYPKQESLVVWKIVKSGTQYWVDSQRELQTVVHEIMKTQIPMAFTSHVHFVDFARFTTLEPPVYINIIRDPLERLVSFYYYRRFYKGHTRPMSRERRNMTFDECVAKNDSECTGPDVDGFFKVVPYFCGHDPICRFPSEAALQRAKDNVIQHYVVIGLTEEMDNFFRALEFVLPQYFKGMNDIYLTMKEKKEETVNKNVYKKINPSEKTVAKMKQLLTMEYEFYYFIRDRFHALLIYMAEHQSGTS